jgi:DNA-binding response OmpR family regulator
VDRAKLDRLGPGHVDMIGDGPETSATHVSVMTSLYRAVKDRNQAHKIYKVDDYLTKPLAFGELRALLRWHRQSAAVTLVEVRE